MKNMAIYDREEKTLVLYDENGTDYVFENVKLFLKKNGYPQKSANWVDIEINDPLFDYGENPRYELIYLRAADGKFIFEARKIMDGYIITADDVMKEIGQIGIA
jgi:hypothetical protein